MRKIKRTKTFLKDIKKLRMNDTQYTKFIVYISKLLNKENLPPEALDHTLQGEWKDTREFHIGGDLLVIYQIKGEELILIRIGTHSQLFK